MCGITGYLSFKGSEIKRPTLEAMTDAISHRGPDDQGCLLYDKSSGGFAVFRKEDASQLQKGQVGLGHRRLSIIDLSENGWQPMISANKQLAISFNGEIYNYIELREELKNAGCIFSTETDTEVILQSYQRWGLECFSRFNGMWALAIYDLTHNHLILSRDRYGKKPLYYYIDREKIIFASEIKSIFKFPSIPKKPNKSKLVNYCARHYRYVDNDCESFFEGIMQVPKAEWMKIHSDGSIQKDLYWELEPILHLPPKKNEKEVIEEFMHLFEHAVELRMRSDVPVGAFLSGGMDSTTLVAIASKMNPNFQTISGVTGEGYYDESEYIQEVVDFTGVSSEFVYPKPEALFPTILEMLTFHDEPICTVTWYSMYLMVKETSKYDISVMLTGHGGDELLAGYWDHYHYHFNDLRESEAGDRQELEAWQKNHQRPISEYREFRDKIRKAIDCRHFEVEKFSCYLDCLSPELRDNETLNSIVYEMEAPSELSRRMYLEMMYETIPASLRAEDRNFMAYSMENRVPFLDHRLAELCFNIDNRLKIKDGLGKYILRKGTRGLLPEKVRNRKDKVGHNLPADVWFRGANRGDIEELISKNNFVNSEIYDVSKVKEVFNDHLSGNNHYMFLWQFINIHLWYRSFWESNS
jgi:asparagine synthase (glutamine-hydrolysing)